jgi:hypothetical protein
MDYGQKDMNHKVRGATVLSIVAERLRNIALPALKRPLVGPKEPPTKELVQWGIKVYAFALISHVRTVLDALVKLSESENITAAQILSRNLFEWTAHACYSLRRLAKIMEAQNWQGAWELLSKVATGNYWAKKHGSKYAPTSTTVPIDVPNSVRVGDLIDAYEEHEVEQRRHANAKDTYSLLSEFSHPNSACLQHYYDWKTSQGIEVIFCKPDPESSTLPVVNWCMIDLMMFLLPLLRLAADNQVAPNITSILKEVAAMAPKVRS